MLPGVTRHEPATPRPDTSTSPAAVAAALRQEALRLGFVAVGCTSADPVPDHARALDRWRLAGHQGELTYLEHPPDRADPRALLPPVRSVVSVALAHARTADDKAGAGIARYAVGADYHQIVRERLHQLADHAATLARRPVLARICVDTAPLLEHALAQRAGVGFAGRHTLTIVPGAGSYVLLGELLLDLELSVDPPMVTRCGTCTRCLDACPTRAFVAPHVLDARRCISYLTIELKGTIPQQLRRLVGSHVFGCDVCQEVCPYNRSDRAPPPDPALAEPSPISRLDLPTLLRLGSAAHRRLTRGTALARVSRARLARNAAVALGNSHDPAAVVPLADALASDPSPLVRVHAAWALGELGEAGRAHLRAARRDPDPEVRQEVAASLWDG